MDEKDIQHILEHGIKMHRSFDGDATQQNKKKKTKKRYINGAHNSGSAKMKAEYRRRRAIKSAKKAARHEK